MTQQSHCWAYTPRKPELKNTRVPQCSSQHCLQQLLLLSRFSCVRLCVTPWTAAYQTPLSMEFSRQELWSGFSFPSPYIYICIHMAYIYICHTFLMHSSVSGRLGGFCILAFVSSAAINIGVHVSSGIIVFSVCVPRSEITRSYGSSIFGF